MTTTPSIPKGNELRERLARLADRFAIACIVSGNATPDDLATVHGAMAVISENACMRRKLKRVVEIVEAMPIADTHDLRRALADVLTEEAVQP